MSAKPRIIIAAISSRAYVQAAVAAGFEVITIDAFCDVDMQAQALQTFLVPAINGSFDATAFKHALKQIDYTDVLGMTIGAGFEAFPDILSKVIKPIFNTPAVIEKVKNPELFFDFLIAIQAPFPPVQRSKPKQSNGWLQKQIGGSGGAHVKAVLPLNIIDKYPVYYQQECAGVPHGCLFLADGKHVQIIGIHQQWCAPTISQPYRFGGAVSQVNLAKKNTDKIEHVVQAITQHFGLRGLNSLDFLVHKDAIHFLEINPRLPASLQLYSAKKGNLFTAHIQACLGKPINWPVIDATSRALQVIYANKTAHVPDHMDWPSWVADIPQPNSEIAVGAPLCTVLATARTAKLAHKKVLQRANAL